MSSGAPRDEARIGGSDEGDAGLRKSVAIGGDRRFQQFSQVEIHPFGLLDAFLDPRRGAERAQYGLQALGTFPSAGDVALLVVAQAFRLKIVQRGTHDGQRRAQLVRQLSAQGAQILWCAR